MEGRLKGWTETHESRFERLWQNYPPRNGVRSDKGGARAEFLALNPSERLCDKILAAIVARKQTREWVREKGAYVPDFRKYIKHQMWEDDLEQPAQPQPAGRNCKNCGVPRDFHGMTATDQKICAAHGIRTGCDKYQE